LKNTIVVLDFIIYLYLYTCCKSEIKLEFDFKNQNTPEESPCLYHKQMALSS